MLVEVELKPTVESCRQNPTGSRPVGLLYDIACELSAGVMASVLQGDRTRELYI